MSFGCRRLTDWLITQQKISSSGGELVHSLGDAGVVDIGEAVGAAADLWDVSDDLLGHGTPPPLPQARPEQQEEALQEKV